MCLGACVHTASLCHHVHLSVLHKAVCNVCVMPSPMSISSLGTASNHSPIMWHLEPACEHTLTRPPESVCVRTYVFITIWWRKCLSIWAPNEHFYTLVLKSRRYRWYRWDEDGGLGQPVIRYHPFSFQNIEQWQITLFLKIFYKKILYQYGQLFAKMRFKTAHFNLMPLKPGVGGTLVLQSSHCLRVLDSKSHFPLLWLQSLTNTVLVCL